MANINGWGRGTWDEGAWGTALPVTLSSLAITSAVGSLTVNAVANVTVPSLVITVVAGAVVQVTASLSR
jgi:hypothetical protein